MKQNLFLLIMLSIFPATCGSMAYRTQTVEPENRTSADTFIVLQTGACERRCPVYRLIIFDDGTLIWYGQAYVKRLGVAAGQGGHI